MAKIYWETDLYPQFLQSIDSCTIAEYSNYEIQDQIGRLAKRSITDFKFPKVPLTYEFDGTTNNDTGIEFGYYFDEEVTQKEINVIVARMKQYWVEFQLSQERIFQNSYYDKDIRLHSPGNTIHNLDKLFKTFKSLADRAEYNYYRVNSSGRPKWGDINDG